MNIFEKIGTVGGLVGVLATSGCSETAENLNKTEVIIVEKDPIGTEREVVKKCVESVESDGK